MCVNGVGGCVCVGRSGVGVGVWGVGVFISLNVCVLGQNDDVCVCLVCGIAFRCV